MGTRIKVSLVKCGRCNKPYSNPLTHVCVTRIGQRQGRTLVRPRVTRDCSRCGKPAGNPLTHVCTTRTDFKKRAAAEKRRQAKEKKARARASAKEKRASSKPAKPQHDYRTCSDDGCARRTCLAYKEGFEAGIGACPLPHGS